MIHRFRPEEVVFEIGGHDFPAWSHAFCEPESHRSASGADLKTPLPGTCAQPSEVLARPRVKGHLQPGKPDTFHRPRVLVRIALRHVRLRPGFRATTAHCLRLREELYARITRLPSSGTCTRHAAERLGPPASAISSSTLIVSSASSGPSGRDR